MPSRYDREAMDEARRDRQEMWREVERDAEGAAPPLTREELAEIESSNRQAAVEANRRALDFWRNFS